MPSEADSSLQATTQLIRQGNARGRHSTEAGISHVSEASLSPIGGRVGSQQRSCNPVGANINTNENGATCQTHLGFVKSDHSKCSRRGYVQKMSGGGLLRHVIETTCRHQQWGARRARKAFADFSSNTEVFPQAPESEHEVTQSLGLNLNP